MTATGGAAFVPLTVAPAGPGYILNKYLVKHKDYLTMWQHVVKNASTAAAMLRDANGSGLQFVENFRTAAANARRRRFY